MAKIKTEIKILKNKTSEKPSVELSDIIIKSILNKNGDEIILLDLANINNTMFDKFILCTANSGIQAETICDEIIYSVHRETKIKPISVEGRTNKEWILIDYFDTLVHIFIPESRSFFKLEQLWADAEIKHINN